MNFNKKKTKSIAAIAMAAMLASTALATTVSAADTGYLSGYLSAQSYAASNSAINAIPNKIYMTNYMSGNAERTAKANAAVTAAQGLLANVDSASLGLPAPAFNGINLVFGSTKYDYLIKANAENGATVLTFNSESALKSAMTKIKTEEQNIMNSALIPYRNYIDSLLTSGAYTKVNTNDDAAVKAAKLSNAALLAAAKNTLTYTYTDTDLFSGDVTGAAKTYQIAYLTAATIGNSSAQSVVSNDEEFTNFPKLVLNGQTIAWSNVHHLDIFNNSNNSWWFALKDGNTLNNDYYWLKGMMIPDFTDTISFDAYAGTEWTQYGNASNSNNNGGNNGNGYIGGGSGTNPSGGSGNTADYNGMTYYYNASYNYISDNIYGVTDGYTTFYYPNYAYAKAAITADSSRYISNVYTSGHSAAARYFSFVNGQYYTALAESPYPYNTAYMRDTSAVDTPASSSSMNYYYNNGNVYNLRGQLIGTGKSRGLTTASTWFCATDGMFYNTAQAGKVGYYVSASDANSIDMSDPYYQYWTMKLNELKNQQKNQNSNSNNNSNNNSSTTKPSGSTSGSSSNKDTVSEIISDDTSIVSAEDLAALRASGDAVRISMGKKAKWLLLAENVIVPKNTNLNITYNTRNIPTALKNAVKKNIAATTELTIGENVNWGVKASLTLKFNEKRENYIAKLYRYDTASSSLVLIDTATIGNNGYVTFDGLSHGGDFFITLG